MSEAEAERFRAGVAACWNVGALSDPARQAIVEVELDLTPEAKPVGETIRLVRPLNPAQAHSQAFEAARRAILRCAGDGHPLPREDYALWRSMILTFDARRMR
ncbi:MAG: hypothetical protein ACKVPY_07495 [Paracoccaceae bacterium]